ncbi:MAG: hypothetical protein ACTSSB_07690 [Candidatus Heimdallarchaeota archaeon]
MKTHKASRNKLFAISIFLIVLVLFIGVNFNNQAKASTNNETTYEPAADHQLVIFDYSHQYKPIYENYSEVEYTFQFLSANADSAKLRVYYTQDFINWTVVEFTDKEKLTDNNYLYKGSLGPFDTIGTYYLKINTTEGIIQYDVVYTSLNVIPISGLLFVDFDYTIKEQSDGNQYVDFYISVIGADLDISKVKLTTDQHAEGDDLVKMNPINESVVHYKATVGPINDWPEIVHITFTANTTLDVVYSSNDFYILKDSVSVPEDFLTSKLPAILVSAIVFISISIMFIQSKRRPPKKFKE